MVMLAWGGTKQISKNIALVKRISISVRATLTIIHSLLTVHKITADPGRIVPGSQRVLYAVDKITEVV